MYHTVNHIINNPNNYKQCNCMKVNWYENEYCVLCGKEKKFKPKGKDIAKTLKKEFPKNQREFVIEV